jgi:16S rRNA (adenine1518-N6/adenine1519-N6)-dimethyltransferase
MLQAGFGQPRKQLHNGISGSLGIPHTDVTKLLEKIGISTNLRPQHLDLSDWVDIYHTIENVDGTLLDIPDGDQ